MSAGNAEPSTGNASPEEEILEPSTSNASPEDEILEPSPSDSSANSRRSSRRLINKTSPSAEIPPKNTSFDLHERKLFLLGIKRYGPDHLPAIQKVLLPHRTVQELELFAAQRNDPKPLRDDYKGKAPIQAWFELASNLTFKMDDFSDRLGHAFSVLGHLEPHDSKSTSSDPNWPLLYNYFGCLLQGMQPPEISPIDSAVVLHLLQELVDHVKKLDISSQRNLMNRKYVLLQKTFKSLSFAEKKEALHKALAEGMLDNLTSGNLSSSNRMDLGTASSTPQASASHGDANVRNDLDSGQESHGVPHVSSPQPSTSTSDQPSTSNTPTSSRKRKRAEEDEDSAEKLQSAILYSINPFCIPIKFLNPLPKRPAHHDCQS